MVIDEDDFLYLTKWQEGHAISGGENIVSLEVERVLYAISKIGEATIIHQPGP